MTLPDALRSPEPLVWSTGRGSDLGELFLACLAGDREKVAGLLDRDPALVRGHYAYRTPLYFAVRANQLDIVALLLERGGDPLSLAVDDSLVDIARDRGYRDLENFLALSLERRCNASRRGEAVAAAIRDRDPARVRSLLDAHPDLLHTGDLRSNRPIHWAVMTRQLDIVDIVLDRGADPNDRRHDGARPIQLTNGDYHYRGWRDVPQEITTTPDDVFRHLERRGAIVDIGMAAARGDEKRVREWLDRDPSLANRVADYGSYYLGGGAPLKNAAATGQLAIVRLLLDRGADPNLPEEGIAPHGHALYAAVAHRHLEVVRLLLERGANPNAEVESSADALSRAISHGDQPMIDLLCAHGATRPVHLLAHYDDLRTAAAVFAANPALADDPEALANAASDAFVRLLLRYQPGLPRRVTVAKSPETTELLVRHGMDPSRPDWLGVTPLHEFARRGDLANAALFLDHGADLHARDEVLDSTPLGWAARFGQREMVDFLLRRGARVRLPDDPPWAEPIAWATRRGQTGIAERLRHFERHGVLPGEDSDRVARSEAVASAIRQADAEALVRWKAVPAAPPEAGAEETLARARAFLAAEHQFPGWTELAAHETNRRDRDSATGRFEDAVEALIDGDLAELRRQLDRDPDLVRARSPRRHGATLLHYVGANGVENFRQRTPANAVAIAELLLDRGAAVDDVANLYGGSTTLGLVATSIHPLRAGVQRELMELLLARGAALVPPAGAERQGPLVNGCLANGRQSAAEFLASRGAPLDLEGAAGVGRLDVVMACFDGDGQLRPGSTAAQRLSGLHWACEYGRTAVVAYLVERGADPFAVHRGQTALHWAAYGGHADIVGWLLERRPSLEQPDEHWHATPLGWALQGWCHPLPGVSLERHFETTARLVKAGALADPAWFANPDGRYDRRMLALLDRASKRATTAA